MVGTALIDLVLKVRFHNLHLIERKRTSLVSADLIRIAHCLRGLHAAHQVIFFLHFADGEGQADCHSEGEALRDGDNDDGDAENEGI